MPNEPLILPALSLSEPGAGVRGPGLVVQNWRAAGVAEMGAPLHVHNRDDEAWHVISGALRFRLADREFVAFAGQTVLLPARVADTFGDSGPGPPLVLASLPTPLGE